MWNDTVTTRSKPKLLVRTQRSRLMQPLRGVRLTTPPYPVPCVLRVASSIDTLAHGDLQLTTFIFNL